MLVSNFRPSARPRRRAHGFTLVELMTAILILTILTTLALPSFREFIANQRIRNASFQLMASLTLARSQAITQNGSVDLKKAGDNWNAGWTVTDGTNTFGAQEALNSLRITDSGGLGTITYGRDGRIPRQPPSSPSSPAPT
jgi:type IV fimbrial biogenesis protein FimT